MWRSGGVGNIAEFYLQNHTTKRRTKKLSAPSFQNGNSVPSGSGSGIASCLVFGPISFNSGDGPLQPMLNVFAQLLFCLARRSDRNPMAIQRNVMAGYIVRTVFFGHKVVEQALMAGMWPSGIAMIGTAERVLKDRSWSPRSAIPVSVSPLFDEIQLVSQHFQHVSLIFRHDCPPGRLLFPATHPALIVFRKRTTLL